MSKLDETMYLKLWTMRLWIFVKKRKINDATSTKENHPTKQDDNKSTKLK